MTNLSKILKCNIPELNEDNLNSLDITSNETPTEIEARVLRLQGILQNVSVGQSLGRELSVKNIEAINTQNMIRAGNTVQSSVLKPGNGRAFSDVLARDMAIVQTWLGNGDEYTQAGWVRESLNRVQRLYRGGLNDAFRRYGFSRHVDELYRDTVAMLRGKGLRQSQIDIITSNSLEKGFYNTIRQSQYIAPRGTAMMEQEYKRFLNSLTSTYGLTPQEAQTVMRSGEMAANAYNQLSSVALDAGLSANRPWDKVPFGLTPSVNLRFNWLYEDENTIRWNTGASSRTVDAFIASKISPQHIVEDEVLMDTVIRALGQDSHSDPLYHYRQAVPGVENPGIGDVLNENYGLSNLMASILKSEHPHVYEALLDSHLLSKLPYSTEETYRQIASTLQFPSKALREVFLVDWRTGMNVYRRQLEHEISRSGFVSLILQRAVDEHWGVSAATRDSNPALYGNFVPIREALNPSVINTTTQHSNPLLDTLYVHPTVRNIARAMQDVLMSPDGMGVFARLIYNTNKSVRQMYLSTIEYLPRQLWQGLISVGASGGNLNGYVSNVGRMFTHSIKPDARVFDDTIKRYPMLDGTLLTQQGLYNYLEDVGAIQSRFDPMTSLEIDPMEATIPARNTLRYLTHTFATEGIGRGLEEMSMVGTQLTSPIAHAISVTNNIVNNAGVLTTVESLLRRKGENAGTYFLRNPFSAGQQFNTVEEAVQHARHYFYYFDDSTYLDKTLREFVIPFYTFLSKNVPAVVRYAVRHPSRFIAHQRLYSLANMPAMNEENINESSVDQWSLDSNPIYWRIPHGRSDGSDAYYVLPMASIDPVQSAVSMISAGTTEVLNAMGIWRDTRTLTTGERLNRNPWSETQTNRLFKSALDQSYSYYSAAVQTVSGEGTDLSGRSLDSSSEFLGIEMNNFTRMWLEALLPMTSTLNRYNPGGFRGTADRYNPRTGEWTLGRPGWLGNRMSGADQFNNENPYSPLMYAGVKVYPVDVFLNMGRSVDDIRISINEGVKFERTLRERALLQSNPDERDRLNAQADRTHEILLQTREDLIKLETFMRRQGLNPQQAYDRLRVRNVRIGDLPNNGIPTEQPTSEQTQ